MKYNIIFTIGLLMLGSAASAQNFEGPNQKERQAWAQELQQREAARLAQNKPTEIIQPSVVANQASQQEKQIAASPATMPAGVQDALQSTGTQGAIKDPVPSVPPVAPVVGNSNGQMADLSQAGSGAAPTGNTAKEAEIRERIKAATSDGKPGRR